MLRRRTRRSPVGHSDSELVSRVRAGDAHAFGELYGRHADAVRAFVLHHGAPAADADDLVAEAFFRVLQAIRNGAGPIEHIRAYLMTVVRRVAAEWAQRRRDVPIDDDELRLRVGAAEEPASSVDRQLITRAFSSLPERWRSVLWQVEVEGRRPREAGGDLGLSANATAALARRARDGLRVAYLQAHLRTDPSRSGCQLVVDRLGAYTAGSVHGIQARQIATHLAGCQSCRSLHAELSDVCAGLRANASAVLPGAGLGTAGLGTGLGGQGLAGAKAGTLAALSLRTKLAVAAVSVTA
ncbi:MAG: sigma-70 family RNA polymerase sigma factor, partial [Sciscionella sp.]|nr:sigma-70 family RNA polymerase sigma factor [Sciscionella sp.]